MAESMAEEANNRRRDAKAKFTRKFNELKKSMDEKKSMDIVKRNYMGLNEAWVNVEAKHDNFCNYLNDEDCTREEPLITELQERFVSVTERQLSYEKDKKAMENAVKSQELQRGREEMEHTKLKRDKEQARIKRHTKEVLFNQTLDDVETSLEREDEDEKIHVPSGIFIKALREMKEPFTECKEANEKYMEFLYETEDLAYEMAWIKTVQKKYNRVTDELEKIIASSKRRKKSLVEYVWKK